MSTMYAGQNPHAQAQTRRNMVEQSRRGFEPVQITGERSLISAIGSALFRLAAAVLGFGLFLVSAVSCAAMLAGG